jgi:hypothetical protein
MTCGLPIHCRITDTRRVGRLTLPVGSRSSGRQPLQACGEVRPRTATALLGQARLRRIYPGHAFALEYIRVGFPQRASRQVASRSAGGSMLWCGEHGAWGVAVGSRAFAPLATLDGHICRPAIGGARRRVLLAVLRLDAGEVVPADRRPPLHQHAGAAPAPLSLSERHPGQLVFWDLQQQPWVTKTCDLVRRGPSRLSRIRSSPSTSRELARNGKGGSRRWRP